MTASKRSSGKFAAAIDNAIAGWRQAVDRASTTELLGLGPPSTWPTASPTARKTRMAMTTVGSRITAKIAGAMATSSTTTINAKSTFAINASGFSIQSASPGMNERTTMPTASGASVEIRMTRTTAPDASSKGRPTRLCSIRISSGITAIASNARIAISPSACPWSPPALVSFSGRSGGIGDIARKIKARSTVGRKSNNRASRTATTGMTTNIAKNDRASRPGRRTKYNKSWTVVLRPKPTTVHTTLTCKASTTSCFRSIGCLKGHSCHPLFRRKPPAPMEGWRL